ncbi:MAG: AAA domain-containing protein [Patescibacteria group bacterium]|nr:AAA domain-containing protein [Patescibacteria group bacterium]
MPLIHLEPMPRRASKGDVVALLIRDGGLDRRHVGRIELRGRQAIVEVPDGWEARLVKALDGRLVGDRRIRAWTTAAASAESACTTDLDHFQRLARLLDLESRAEAQRAAEQARRMKPEEAQQAGSTLLDMVVRDEQAGLGGRYLVTLGRRDRAPLAWTRLDVGSPVVVSPNRSKQEALHRGVVCQRSAQTICVALERLPEDLADHATWRVDLSFDDAAVERQRAALEQARLARGDRFAILRDVLVGRRQPEFGVDPEVRPLDRNLNPVQREAVQFALSGRDVALIHGPPGTGKTVTLVEVIRQAVRRGRKVLVCAPSNLAVDNLFERLLGYSERAVRLGHPARVLPQLRDHTLDLLVERHRDVRLARKFVKQAVSLFREADRHTRAAPKPGAKRQLREDAKSLMADARRMEMQAVDGILDSASVLCATTTALDSRVLGDRRFDLAVIDEACQSTEPGCWIPLLRCDRVVLAGDHCQLPPTVVSREAAAGGFGTSMFERLLALHGSPIAQRLTVQYRMHESIMGFSSAEFYDGQLQADPSVAAHRLADIAGVSDGPFTRSPVEFIDTAGASFDEDREPDGESRLNRREAELASRKVHELLDHGVRPADIAVIAPYAAQVRLLRERLPEPGLEIDSVDGFQGREKEAVVISLVRSNMKGEIGFLSDVRRTNVALTRARRKLIVIGDSATLGREPFYQRMLEYFEAIGAYGTVWETGMA